MLPKLFNAGPGDIVRTHNKEYRSTNGEFRVNDFEDFYTLIKQGYMLFDDPRINKEAYAPRNTMGDDDVLALLKNKKRPNQPEDISVEEIKNRAYGEFYAMIQNKIQSGELEGYPVDMKAQAKDFVEAKLRQHFDAIGSETIKEEVVDTPVDTPEVVEDESLEEAELNEKENNTSETQEVTEEVIEIKKSYNKKGKKKIKEIEAESSVDVSASL